MTAREKVERDNKIVTARLRGRGWASIAAEFDVAESTARLAFEEWRNDPANQTLRHVDPLMIVDEVLGLYQGAIEELAEIANEQSVPSSVRVGAINSKVAAIRQRLELAQAVGILPHDLNELWVRIDAATTSRRLIAVMQAHDTPVEVMQEIIAVLGEGGVETKQLTA